MKIIGPRTGEPRGWPGYLFGGRVRTSTFALVVAFFATWWLYYTYQPTPAPSGSETQMVPPGFVPDPEYTWVPRTSVRERPTTSTTLTTTTTSGAPNGPAPAGVTPQPATSGPTTTQSPTSSTAPSTATTTSSAPTTAPTTVPTVPGAPGAAPMTSQRAQ